MPRKKMQRCKNPPKKDAPSAACAVTSFRPRGSSRNGIFCGRIVKRPPLFRWLLALGNGREERRHTARGPTRPGLPWRPARWQRTERAALFPLFQRHSRSPSTVPRPPSPGTTPTSCPDPPLPHLLEKLPSPAGVDVPVVRALLLRPPSSLNQTDVPDLATDPNRSRRRPRHRPPGPASTLRDAASAPAVSAAMLLATACPAGSAPVRCAPVEVESSERARQREIAA